MFDKLRRSYDLMSQSWRLLLLDKELIAFPILSGLSSIALLGLFAVPFAMTIFKTAPASSEGGEMPVYWYALWFVFYVLAFFVTYFFNVAVMWCAAMRMDGKNPTVGDGLRGAGQHVGRIFTWALVSAVVGVILNAIEERLGFIGRIITSLLGCAFAVITAFAIPVLIFERVGVGEVFGRAATLLKRSWGEGFVGTAGIGVVTGWLSLLGIVPMVLASYLYASTESIALAAPLAGIAIVYWLVLAVVSSALTSIFRVALYRYAARGDAGNFFSKELLAAHFQPRS